MAGTNPEFGNDRLDTRNDQLQRNAEATNAMPIYRAQQVGDQLKTGSALYARNAPTAQGRQLHDAQGNNIGGVSTPHGNKSLDFWSTYRQEGTTLKNARTGETMGSATIDIPGSGYKLNVVGVQNGQYRAEGQQVKDRQWNTVCDLMTYKQLTRTIKRNPWVTV